MKTGLFSKVSKRYKFFRVVTSKEEEGRKKRRLDVVVV